MSNRIRVMVIGSLGLALAAGCVGDDEAAEPTSALEAAEIAPPDTPPPLDLCAEAQADKTLVAVNNDFLGQDADSVDASYSQGEPTACKAFLVDVSVGPSVHVPVVDNTTFVAPAIGGKAVCESFREDVSVYRKSAISSQGFQRINAWFMRGVWTTSGHCELVANKTDVSCDFDDRFCELPRLQPPALFIYTYRIAIKARTQSTARQVKLHIAAPVPQLPPP